MATGRKMASGIAQHSVRLGEGESTIREGRGEGEVRVKPLGADGWVGGATPPAWVSDFPAGGAHSFPSRPPLL